MLPTARRLTANRPQAIRMAVLALAVLLMGLVGCSSDPAPEVAFCDAMKAATGPDGAESVFERFDPDRITETAAEIRSLAELAPADIAPTMSGLSGLFDALEDAPSDDWPSILIENESENATWSAALNDYALTECGIFLQRAPIPTPTSAPLILGE